MTFLWGAATSSHQIEGYNEHNDWWAWESEGNVEGGVRSGAATDHWNRAREDIRLAAELGLNSYRFSIEWSRFEPKEGLWNDSPGDIYFEIASECRRHGIEPMVTLHHFTLPKWIADRGGFTWNETPDRFGAYVRRIAKLLGPKVRFWCTINEPMVLAIGSYIGKFMPPAVFSPESLSRACAGMLRAHAKAYDILHTECDDTTEVGIAHNMIDFQPDRPWHPLERGLAWAIRRFYNQAWLDAVTGGPQRFGIPGLIPSAPTVAEARGRRTVDFIGVNYYTKGYIQWRPRDQSSGSSSNVPIGLAFSRRKEKASDLGWAVHPEGLQKMLEAVKGLGLPVYITENGIADHTDSLRPDYLISHLREVAKARSRGIDVRGYYYWSLLDNFEWIKGFKPRFGLFQVDYDTFERTETYSARVLRKLIADHRGAGLDGPTEQILETIR